MSTATESPSTLLNDLHSQLNPTQVARVSRVRGTEDLIGAVAAARRAGESISIAGARHAMGGQQFGQGSLHLDTREHNRIVTLDPENGLVEAEAGILWSDLIARLHELQRRDSAAVGGEPGWGIRQKQTGADRLSLGGSVSANVHGRGLTMPPLIADIEGLTVIGADGVRRRLSREREGELFRHVCGGYGLFGLIDTVTLRLRRRQKLERRVAICGCDEALGRFAECIEDGHLYGDLQLDLDPDSDGFLRRGVFSTYRPVAAETPMPPPGSQRHLSEASWSELTFLTHCQKARAWEVYSAHYQATDGQLYWSDTHQLSTYLDGYHAALDRRLKASCPGSDVISELYVPRPLLDDFLSVVAADFRRHSVNCIYSTVRLIERDAESALPWAQESFACVIFNLHTDHTPTGMAQSAAAFRRLIDLALARGGSYFLTYHRHATREQLLEAHPRFPAFLETKLEVDPEERFVSDWYRHYRDLLASERR